MASKKINYDGLPSSRECLISQEEKEPIVKIELSLSANDLNRIIEMAWEDRTPFDAIEIQFGLKEQEVKALMKKNLKFSSYKLWRIRVGNRKTKHAKKIVIEGIDRFKCRSQRSITMNKISKRRF